MTMTAIDRESSTVFDDVFRTMLERLERLMIPVINEVFDVNYPMDMWLNQLKNKHVTDKMKNVTDSHLQVGSIDVGGNQYHMECESNSDGNISIRMIEYDFAIALENTVERDGVKGIRFPNSCILHLRQTKNTKEKELVKIEFADLLDKLRMCQEIEDAEYSYLLDSIHKVADHILRNTPVLKERVGEIMGGKVLRLRTDEIIEEGITKGIAIGEQKGALAAYIDMIKEGLVPIALAAAKLGMSEGELQKHI